MGILRTTTKRCFYKSLNRLVTYSPAESLILEYHYINYPSSPYSVQINHFRSQLDMLSKNYELVPLDELKHKFPNHGDDHDLPLATLTFDDGTLNNYEVVYPTLEEFNIKATFFIVTDYLGEHFPATGGTIPMMDEAHVKELHNNGHEIGAHSKSHRNLTDLSVKEATREIVDSKEYLESLIQDDVTSFAYPNDRYNKQLMEKVNEVGFKAAVVGKDMQLRKPINWMALPRVKVDGQGSLSEFSVKTSTRFELVRLLRESLRWLNPKPDPKDVKTHRSSL